MSRVIIVGGGLAGLNCARRLHEQSIPFDLYEASDAFGGRVRTDLVDGFRLDRGFQVLLTAYPAAQSALDYQQLDLRSFEAGAVIRRGGKFHRFADPWRQPQYFLSTAFSSLATFADKLRVGKMRTELSALSIAKINQSEEQSSLEYLRGRGFSDAIIGSFFKPFFGGVFLEPELATTSRKLQFVFKMFSAGDAAVPALGMQEIPAQLAAGLPAESLHLNQPAVAVSANEVQLEGGETEQADAVVLAVDATTANRLLGKQESVAWNQVRCVYFSAAKAPMRGAVLILNGDGRGPINNLCTMTEAAPEYSSDERSLVSVSVLDASVSDEDLTDRVLEQARDWFGDAASSWRHIKTYDIRQALPRQDVGCLDPPTEEDGVIRCGDVMELASIQSALASGRRAADDAAARMLTDVETS